MHLMETVGGQNMFETITHNTTEAVSELERIADALAKLAEIKSMPYPDLCPACAHKGDCRYCSRCVTEGSYRASQFA